MNLLLCGGVDIPPPIGGLARRVINHSSVLCTKGVNVHALLMFKKARVDTMGTKIRVHSVFSTEPAVDRMGAMRPFVITLPQSFLFAVRHPHFTISTLFESLSLLAKRSFSLGYFLLSLHYITRIDQIIKENKIDVVLTHYALETSYFSIKAAKLSSKPVVLETFGESIFWETERGNSAYSYSPLFNYVFNNVSCIIAPSRHCLKGAKRYVHANIPSKVIISGIDIGDFTASEEREHLKKAIGYQGKKIVLFVNRLDSGKGPQYLVHIAPQVIKEVPNVRFVFVGRDAGIKSELERTIEQQETSDHMLFTGVLSDAELRKYYAASDVLVFPSTTERECMGMSMKEAMANGTPVIAFRSGGAPEAIECGVSGYVVNVGDTQALEHALVRILSDDELWRDMSYSARQRALRIFDKNITGNEINEVLEEYSKKPLEIGLTSDVSNGREHNILRNSQDKVHTKSYSLVVGCGYTSQRELCRCGEVLALDIDREKILKAHKNDRNAHYVVCDACFLPLRPNTFKDVVCSDILEHITYYEKVLRSIVGLKPDFIYLRYPTEAREKILTKASKVYAEQVWGRIHVVIVNTQSVAKILQDNGFLLAIDFTSAVSTLNRVFSQKTLEILHVSYTIPDLGFLTIKKKRLIYKPLIYLFSLIAQIGEVSYYLWKLFKVETLHDNCVISAYSASDFCQ